MEREHGGALGEFSPAVPGVNEPGIGAPENNEIDTITFEEIGHAVKRVKPGKAPGLDEITV